MSIRYLRPCMVLQSSTSVAQERHSGWSSDSVITELSLASHDSSCSLPEIPGWLCWQYGLSQLMSVGSRMMNNRVRSKYSTWQHLLIRRRGFITWGTRFEHTQQPPISMHWANSQAIIRYNKLNYDVIDIHCTALSKMKLIHGWDSPGLAWKW